MTTRSTLKTLKAVNGNALVTAIGMMAVKKGNGFVVTAHITTADGQVEICDVNGKVKQFTAIDDIIMSAAKVGVLSDSLALTFDNLALLAPAPFTGDLVNKNQKLVDTYTTASTNAGEKIASLVQQLALMAGDNTIAASVVAEKTAQKTAVEAYKAYLDAEITRINALLNPGG